MSPNRIVPGSRVHVSVFDFLEYVSGHKKPGMDVRALLTDFRSSYQEDGDVKLTTRVWAAVEIEEASDKARLREIFIHWTKNCELCGEPFEPGKWLTRKKKRVGQRFMCINGHREDRFNAAA